METPWPKDKVEEVVTRTTDIGIPSPRGEEAPVDSNGEISRVSSSSIKNRLLERVVRVSNRVRENATLDRGNGLSGLDVELEAFANWNPEREVSDPQRWNRCPWLDLLREIQTGLPGRALKTTDSEWVSDLLVGDLVEQVQRASLLPRLAKAGRIERLVKTTFLACTFALAADVRAPFDWTPSDSLLFEAVLMGCRDSVTRMCPNAYRRIDEGVARQALELMRKTYEEQRDAF